MRKGCEVKTLTQCLWSSVLLIGFLCLSLAGQSPAQGKKKVGEGGSTGGSSGSGKKKVGEGGSVSVAVPKVVTTTRIKEVLVKPNEGALSLVTVPQAVITLQPANRKTNKALKPYKAEADGTLALESMTPGQYDLKITHPDYESFEKQISISRGQLVTENALLRSKYGVVKISGLPPGVKLSVDGAPVDAKADEAGTIVLQRVPVGEHEFRASLARYDDWVEKAEVKSGETVELSRRLTLSTVALTIKARPTARVYINDEEKGLVQNEGTLTIPPLPPGDYTLRIILDGFETIEKKLSLRLDNRRPTENIELTPIAESGEATDNFRQGLLKWSPAPAAWKVDKATLRVSGNTPSLFKDATEARPFNVYRDFTWDFDFSFANGKGAAWIVRARDTQNYYLFELTTKSAGQQRLFNFYVCRNGKLELKDSRDVVENLEKTNDSFHISLKAAGNQFVHTIIAASNPKGEAEPLGTFTDDTFSYGGLGFQTIKGAEMIIRSFVVIPVQRANK